MGSIYGRLPVTGHYQRRSLRLAGPARALAGFCVVLLACAILVYRIGALAPVAMLGLLAAIAIVGACVFVLCAASLVRVWIFGTLGGPKAFAGLSLASLALLPFATALYLATANPRANAAYTEGVEPNLTERANALAEAAAVPMTYGARMLLADEAPAVLTGRRYYAGAPVVFRAAQRALAERGWHIADVVAGTPRPAPQPGPDDLGVRGTMGTPLPTFRSNALAPDTAEDEIAGLFDQPDEDRYRIEAVARDMMLGLPSDIVITLTERGAETIVEVQSVSRSPAIDFGENRRFIERFLAGLDAAMVGREAVGRVS